MHGAGLEEEETGHHGSASGLGDIYSSQALRTTISCTHPLHIPSRFDFISSTLLGSRSPPHPDLDGGLEVEDGGADGGDRKWGRQEDGQDGGDLFVVRQ